MLQTPYPFTPKGEAALRQAEHLARRLHHKYIGTEHLLLGLLSSPCLASYVLKLHEVTEEMCIRDSFRAAVPCSSPWYP